MKPGLSRHSGAVAWGKMMRAGCGVVGMSWAWAWAWASADAAATAGGADAKAPDQKAQAPKRSSAQKW